ncbi:glycosyltransferase [Microvirga solisilvae]|uniref:glycosyltransferase n=1 Tax=Microvirga solisilvae TaxID=2919498 RepID=UPI001FAF5637|nr:glycosyltransferase [Microvirga solisilvae]
MSSLFLNSDTDGTVAAPKQTRSLSGRAKGRIERFIFGTERSLQSLSPELPPGAIQTYPSEAEGQRVLLLVANSVDHDTRVKKTAAALRSGGYSVGILGITKKNAEHTYSDPGLVRAPFIHLSYRLCILRNLYKLGKQSKARKKRKFRLYKGLALAELARQYAVTHDSLLQGLSDQPSLSKKLLAIATQWARIKRSQYHLRREENYLKTIQRIDATYERHQIKYYEKTRKKHSFYKKYIGPFGKYIDYYISTSPYMKEFKPDIIHANDLYTLPAAIRYRDKHAPHARVIYDSHEFEMHRNKEYNFVKNIADQLIEWRYIRKVDHVITVSDGIADALARSYNIPRPAVVLNSPSVWRGDLTNRSGLKEKTGVPQETVLIVYTGAVTFGRGLEILVKSLEHLPQNYHVAILGPRRQDKDAELLEVASQSSTASRIHLVPSVAPNEVPALISDADLFINPAQNVCLSYDLALPNKLFDAVFAHVPILVGDLTEMRQFVMATGAGISREMTTPEQMAAAIEEAVTLRKQGYFDSVDWSQIAQSYSWEVQTQRLIEIYGSLSVAR